MQRVREVLIVLGMAACGSLLSYRPASGAEPIVPGPAPQGPSTISAPDRGPVAGRRASAARRGWFERRDAETVVTVGKSLIIDSPMEIRRVSVANGDLAEAVAVNPKEVLINGKLPGETSLIVWQQNGARLIYDLTVRMSTAKLDAARQQIARDFPTEDINFTFENDTAFVRGTVRDVTAADRVMMIASTLGKAINLLRVDVPAWSRRWLLKVRFANVDRGHLVYLGANFFNGSFNQLSVHRHRPFCSPRRHDRARSARSSTFCCSGLTSTWPRRSQLLKANECSKCSPSRTCWRSAGKQASFLAGGEFPFPMVQPSGGSSSISIMWREYGIRLNFLPTVTPRGTIRLRLPRKSARWITPMRDSSRRHHSGLSHPARADGSRARERPEFRDRRTDGQPDERNLSKIPGIGNIRCLGKLFKSQAGDPQQFGAAGHHHAGSGAANSRRTAAARAEHFRSLHDEEHRRFRMRQPGMDKTGPVPVKPPVDSMPVEQLMRQRKEGQPPPARDRRSK